MTRIDRLNEELKNLECTDHIFRIRCKKASNDALMYKWQCVRCGELKGDWIKHDKILKKDDVEPINLELIDTYMNTKNELKRALHEAIRGEVTKEKKDEWQQDAAEYYNSQEWMVLRRRVMGRAGATCEGCLNARAAEIHHLAYQNWRNEFCFELVALCEDCHERYHKNG